MTDFDKEYKPQMNAPSRASGGCIHVCPQAYVSMHNGGHDADERRYDIAPQRTLRTQSQYFALFAPFAVSSKNEWECGQNEK